jgi:hypothetical protein
LNNSLKKPEKQDNSSCGDLIPRTKQISRLAAAGLESEGIGTGITWIYLRRRIWGLREKCSEGGFKEQGLEHQKQKENAKIGLM